MSLCNDLWRVRVKPVVSIAAWREEGGVVDHEPSKVVEVRCERPSGHHGRCRGWSPELQRFEGWEKRR